ncbi:hypothetical protein D3C76_1125920 [compost metagenome]
MQFASLDQRAGSAGRIGVVLAEQAGDVKLLRRRQLPQFAAQPVQVLGGGLRVEVDHQQRSRTGLHALPERVVTRAGIDYIGQRRLVTQGNELATEEFGEGAFGEVRPGEQYAGVG